MIYEPVIPDLPEKFKPQNKTHNLFKCFSTKTLRYSKNSISVRKSNDSDSY